MGRRRKTRWRRLSIGENSPNEDEDYPDNPHHENHNINSSHSNSSGAGGGGNSSGGNNYRPRRSSDSAKGPPPLHPQNHQQHHHQHQSNHHKISQNNSSPPRQKSVELHGKINSSSTTSQQQQQHHTTTTPSINSHNNTTIHSNNKSTTSTTCTTTTSESLSSSNNSSTTSCNSKPTASNASTSSTQPNTNTTSTTGGGKKESPSLNGHKTGESPPEDKEIKPLSSISLNSDEMNSDGGPPPPTTNTYNPNYQHSWRNSGDGKYHGGGGGWNSNGYRGHYNNYHRGGHHNHHHNHNHHGGGGGENNNFHGDHQGQDGPPSRGRFENGGYRGGGRFRKPRSFPHPSAYHYYNNSAQNFDNAIRPAYNQEEYTKITTPRQDVLFKKGYLSAKKPDKSPPAGGSADSTPAASTNGTPDTQSTNGVHSDYSETSYENGEAECGHYEDPSLYYGPEAMYTDPNTGQVYYGQPGGGYYDPYQMTPLMVAGYPPVYYHLPYPYPPPGGPGGPGDWYGGMPHGMYAPMMPMHHPHHHQLPPQGQNHQPAIEDSNQSAERQNGTTGSDKSTSNVNGPSNSNSIEENGQVSSGPPMPPTMYMQGHGHPPGPYIYPVFAPPPIYNGVQVANLPPNTIPQAETTSTTVSKKFEKFVEPEVKNLTTNPQIAPKNRKKRKKRQRKKDGQELTDEGEGDEGDEGSNSNETEESEDNIEPQDTTTTTSKSKLKLNLTQQSSTLKQNSVESSDPDQESTTTISTTSAMSTSTSTNNSSTKGSFSIPDSISPPLQELHQQSGKKLSSEIDSQIVQILKLDEEEGIPLKVKRILMEGSAASLLGKTEVKEEITICKGDEVEKTLLLKGVSKKLADLCILDGGAGTGNSGKIDDLDTPSSPDSLNTNQSIAGSEAHDSADRDNLSVSETNDFLNRTTSIEEVEEDLENDEVATITTSTTIQTTIVDENGGDKSVQGPPININHEEIFEVDETSESSVLAKSPPPSAVQEKTGDDEEGSKIEVKIAEETKPQASGEVSTSTAGEEHNDEKIKSKDGGSSPGHIVMAVSEWLSSQPQCPLNVSVGPSKGDDGEDKISDNSDDDQDLDDDDEKNSKNSNGSPWTKITKTKVAPSNKKNKKSLNSVQQYGKPSVEPNRDVPQFKGQNRQQNVRFSKERKNTSNTTVTASTSTKQSDQVQYKVDQVNRSEKRMDRPRAASKNQSPPPSSSQQKPQNHQNQSQNVKKPEPEIVEKCPEPEPVLEKTQNAAADTTAVTTDDVKLISRECSKESSDSGLESSSSPESTPMKKKSTSSSSAPESPTKSKGGKGSSKGGKSQNPSQNGVEKGSGKGGAKLLKRNFQIIEHVVCPLSQRNCDPSKASKYYQFGFGYIEYIERDSCSSGNGHSTDEMDIFDENRQSTNSPTTTSTTNSNNDTDVMKTDLKKCDLTAGENGNGTVSTDDDGIEDIGTFDPNRAKKRLPCTMTDLENASNFKNNCIPLDAELDTSTSKENKPKSPAHGNGNGNDGCGSSTSSDDEKIPYYESPICQDPFNFNSTTTTTTTARPLVLCDECLEKHSKIIKKEKILRHLDPLNCHEKIPCAICCSLT